MIQHSGQRSAKLVGIGSNRHAAAFAVRECDDAVDAVRQRIAFKTGGDQLGSVRGAIAGGHHRDVVPRARAPVFALKTEEGWNGIWQLRPRRLRGGKLVGERQFLKADVVDVNVVAGLDRGLGSPHHLSVANHNLVGTDLAQRHFVAGRHIVQSHYFSSIGEF